MIHPLTLVTFAAFLGSGLYVFHTKEEVAKLDRELRSVTREIEGERSRTQTLSAEWARLNDQDRLRSMVSSYLPQMQPMEPSQFQRLDDAQRRMPQAVAFVAEASTGFRRRADAPSAPGEVLVFNIASMQADAPARRGAPVQRVIEAPVVAAAAAPVVAAPVVAPAHAPVVVAAAAPALVLPPAPAAIEATVRHAAAAPRAPAAPRIEVAALPPIAGPATAGATTRASALPPIAGPATVAAPVATPVARLAEAPRPAPRARAEAPRPSQLAQAQVSAPPTPLRTAMHVQPAAASGGSLIGGGMSLPPPVPFGR
ncbi:cell division protein FtsL [Roseococcus sp.]|uniref:cell division protein FtsL n=1 Tax=Roseococcus sp. TaxID=2109646 RepID=UPI003BA8E326